MPPVGRPRPDEATYGEVIAWLEAELDRAAVNAPNPGRRPALHRLSRTEYQNAVRDLLALDDLPKEFDVSTLLPADNVTSGFDNLAELLFVSPSTLERYLAAARKISRLAVGDTSMPPIVDRYQLDRDLIQDGHLDGLPLGPRAYPVVMTHSFAHDREWVRRLLGTGVSYIGLLGPSARRDEILHQVGATATGRLFAPVGLDLGADGPEQVAVSIVAELLAVRASSAPRHLREKEGVIHAG